MTRLTQSSHHGRLFLFGVERNQTLFLLAGLLSKAADAEQVTAQPCRPDAWRADSLHVEGEVGHGARFGPGFIVFLARPQGPGVSKKQTQKRLIIFVKLW